MAPRTEEAEVEELDEVPLIEGEFNMNIKVGSKLTGHLR